MSVIAQLKDKLTQALNASVVEIEDESWKHAGHREAGTGLEATHLSMIIVSEQFDGVSLLDRHRMVHEVLKEAREKHLHALQLKTLTPTEWRVVQGQPV